MADEHFTAPGGIDDELPETNPPGYWLDQLLEVHFRRGYEQCQRDVQEALDARSHRTS